MEKKIIIVGGGIAGLSAGIYARLNGFDTTILEMREHAGGLCTSWQHDGYLVNGSLHWLVGSSPGPEVYSMWEQLGIIEGSEFRYHDTFVEYSDIGGVDVHFYTDPFRLGQHLKEISPDDKHVIEELASSIRTLSAHDLPLGKSSELLSAWDRGRFMLSHFPVVRLLMKYTPMTVGDFADSLRSEVLRTAFKNFWSPEMSMSFFLFQMAFASKGQAGYLVGGSGAFTGKLMHRYETLGGKIEYGVRATAILTENHSAVSVRTATGSEYFADYIISACDGRTALFEMLGEKFLDKKTIHAYKTLETFPSLLFFSAGINRTFPEVTPAFAGLNIPLKEPVFTGKVERTRATFQIYNFDPTLAPQGKTLITAMLHADYDYWNDLFRQNQTQYHAEQEVIGQRLVQGLEHQFPGITPLVEFADVATPVTYETLTGNYKGSYEGWLPTPAALRMTIPSHFSAIKNFYVAGHWQRPGGGMPPSAFSGRDAVELICRQEHKSFDTSEPVEEMAI